MGEIPNVHVTKKGSINAWINNAFAVMHNGCTTALETIVSKKPLVTYDPFQPPITVGKLANELGFKVQSLEKLSNIINSILENKNPNDQNPDKRSSEIISKKVFSDDNELAAQKIVKIWEDIGKDKFFKSTNWLKFKYLLRLKV